jgi:hypothetical protein
MKSIKLTTKLLAISFIAILFISTKHETITVKRKVTDTDGDPINNCFVYEKKNPKKSVKTDIESTYIIEKEKKKILVFSSLRYKEKKDWLNEILIFTFLYYIEYGIYRFGNKKIFGKEIHLKKGRAGKTAKDSRSRTTCAYGLQ